MPLPRSSRIIKHSARSFSTTPRRLSHYQTLGVPQDATKATIKSSFYRLSKEHHPDLSKDPKSRDVFTKLNAAYQVLVNDRDRRAYDRSLMSRSHPLGGHHYTPHAPHTRTPKATHAWETKFTARTAKGTYTYSARSTGGFRRAPPDPEASTTPQHPAAGTKPFTREAHRDILSGSRRRKEDYNQELDKVRNTNTTFRALQILGFLAVTASLLGYSTPRNA
ncbi:DnaJ domain-containing protein [Coprinopsis sp. MPI-PUGE-AT-0042]|nr:DnaJ domain-containing protein [Coprinopsis sp. MPI-PUGE-AT-0042]